MAYRVATARASSDGKPLCPLTTVSGARFGLIQERTPLIAASSSTTTTRPRKNRRAQVEKDDSRSVDHGVCRGSCSSRDRNRNALRTVR